MILPLDKEDVLYSGVSFQKLSKFVFFIPIYTNLTLSHFY